LEAAGTAQVIRQPDPQSGFLRDLREQVRADLQDLTARPGDLPVTDTDFRRYGARRTALIGRLLLLCGLANLLLWLPTDFLLFPPPVLPSILAFRGLLFAVAGAAYLSLPRRADAGTGSYVAVAAVFLLIIIVAFGYMGFVGGVLLPQIYTAYILPALTPAFMFRLRDRILLNVACCAVALFAFYGPHRGYWTFPEDPTVLIYLFVAVSASTVVGHMMYRQERIAFVQRLEIQKHAAHLEELDRQKDAFIATISHELRTPLNAIVGLSDVVLDEQALPVETRGYLRTIHNSGEVLLRLLNDMLDLARMKSGKLVLESLPVSLYDLVETSVSFFVVTSREKQLDLSFHVPWATPHILGDPNRLSQILLNLIGNAVKFTQSGEVSVTVATSKLPSGDAEVTIEVADTGPGIPPERREAVFEEFVQVAASTSRQYGGTGLGLPIVRRLARLMGGDVAVADNVPRGSILRVTFPAPIVADADDRPTLPDALVKDRPLVVLCEPHPLRRQRLTDSVQHLGLSLQATSTLDEGASALDEAARKGKPARAVLIGPSCSNPEVLARSSLAKSAPQATALMAIADLRATPQEMATYERLGIWPVLSSPVRRRELRDAFHRVLSGTSKRTAESMPPRSPRPPAGKARRILVVDDVPENRVLIHAFVRSLLVDVEFGETGSEAVEKFARGVYDMVFMDMEMPETDGFSAVQQIRAWEEAHGSAPTPIISISAHADETSRERARQAGFTALLQKPIRKKDFLRTLSQAGPLETREVERPRSISAEFLNLRPAYLNQQRQQAQLVGRWLADRRFDEIRRLGQKIKGSAGAYGLMDMSSIGEQIEAAANNSDADAIRALVSELESSIARHLPNA
jgi:signal transduction histidine kinase/CheY-like chemotaxis protein